MSEHLRLDLIPNLPQTDFLSELAGSLWQRDSVIGLWLEGSMGRGTADPYSDVDLYAGVTSDSLDDWQSLDVSVLFGDAYAAHYYSYFDADLFVFHVFLKEGHIYDLHILGRDHSLPKRQRLILGCRDKAWRTDLTNIENQPFIAPPIPIDPAVVEREIIIFWVNLDKGRKLIYRDLELIIINGLYLMRQILLRLLYMDVTGEDCGNLIRLGIHPLKPVTQALQPVLGEELALLMGAPATTRAELYAANMQLGEAASRLGRSLAKKHGFDYPEALERAVIQNWETFRAKE